MKLRFEDVLYIESMGDFSKIYTRTDKKHITLVSLKNMEAQLPQQLFTRIHKQYIINNSHISSIGAYDLVIADKHTLPLSQASRQGLLDKVVNMNIVARHIAK